MPSLPTTERSLIQNLRLQRLRVRRGGSAAHNKFWEGRNPEKAKAHRAIEYAVTSGKLQRAPCVICGAKAQAHHEDYSKPLRVIWLCHSHHVERHVALRKGGAENWSHHEVEAQPSRNYRNRNANP